MSQVAAAVRGSSLSEISWVDPQGRPQVRGTIALLRGESPVLAFTYAEEAVAREIAGVSTLVLTMSETRSTGRGFSPMLLRGRPRLTEDPAGEVFVDELLTEELRRFPPARAYADSALLRREHWWFLPRLIVELDLDSAQPHAARRGSDDHLLVVAHGDRPVVHLVSLVERSRSALTLDLHGQEVPSGEAVLFGQDGSFPDLEQWSQWRFRGHWDGSGLEVREAPDRTGLAPPLNLLGRWRRQRDFARRCRAAIP